MSSSRRSGPESTVLWGYLLVAASFLWFFSTMFVLAGTKLLPETGNALLDFLRTDWYYSLLVPNTIPVVLVAVYLVWFSRKLYQHS